MRTVLFVGSATALLFLCLTGTAVAATVEFIGTHQDMWVLPTDPIVAHYENMIWSPPGDRERRDFEDVPGGLTNAQVCTMQRCPAWRLDTGQLTGIDWMAVKAELCGTYGCTIGSAMLCVASGTVTAPKCYSATIDVYSIYTRDSYRVTQGNVTATISVFRPTDGIGLVYSDLSKLDNSFCETVAGPSNVRMACASTASQPTVGTDCLYPNRRPTKRGFEDPTYSGEQLTPATWGKIKALYDTE